MTIDLDEIFGDGGNPQHRMAGLPKETRAEDDNPTWVGDYADREWLRFWAVAVERPSGNGWTDPGAWPNGEPWWMDADAWPIRNPDPTPWPEIPEGTPGPLADLARERPGWAVEAWRDRLRQLAKACADANPERSGELRQAAELILTY